MNKNRVDDLTADRVIKELTTCNVCEGVDVIRAETRLAELPAEEQEVEVSNHPRKINYFRAYQAIGISFLHMDGSVCDEPMYKLVRI